MRVNVESPAAQGTVTDSKGHTARIAWSGLTGHLSDRDNRATLDIQAPSLSVESGDTRLDVGDIRIEGSGRSLAGESVPDEPADWQSNGRVSIGQFRIADKRDGRELSFSAHAGARLSADDANDTDGLAYRTRLAFDDVHLVGFEESDSDQPFDIDTLGLSLSLTGLKTAPLQAMMARIREFQDQLDDADTGSRDRGNRQIGMMALTYLPKILAGSPVLTLEIPPAKTSHGTLGARIEVTLEPRGGGAPDMASQPLVGFLQRVAVKGNTFTDRELADWLISRSSQPAQARKTLRQLIDQNLLVAHDGRISAKLYADIEALRINGQSMPPGMRQGLLAAIVGGAAAMAAPSQ